LREDFGIELTEEERRGIRGMVTELPEKVEAGTIDVTSGETLKN